MTEKDSTEEPRQRTVLIIATGRVQHVGFRACVKRMAQNLTVAGEVMNLSDGTVSIRATAEPAIIDKFLSLLYSCPRAVVRDLQVTETKPSAFEGFSVIFTDLSA